MMGTVDTFTTLYKNGHSGGEHLEHLFPFSLVERKDGFELCYMLKNINFTN